MSKLTAGFWTVLMLTSYGKEIFVNIPLPADHEPGQNICKIACHGQTSPGKLGGSADSQSRQQWHAMGYQGDPTHMMLIANVDMSECGFRSPPVVSVSLATNLINKRWGVVLSFLDRMLTKNHREWNSLLSVFVLWKVTLRSCLRNNII